MISLFDLCHIPLFCPIAIKVYCAKYAY